jgi:hypothetical protein
MPVKEIIYDESKETYEDSREHEDKDELETLSELQQEETGKKPVHKRMAVSGVQVHLETSREKYEATILRNDTLRKKYDIRYQKGLKKQ